MRLKMVLYEIILKYNQFLAESALFFTFLYILRTARVFGSIAKKGVGWIFSSCKSHNLFIENIMHENKSSYSVLSSKKRISD